MPVTRSSSAEKSTRCTKYPRVFYIPTNRYSSVRVWSSIRKRFLPSCRCLPTTAFRGKAAYSSPIARTSFCPHIAGLTKSAMRPANVRSERRGEVSVPRIRKNPNATESDSPIWIGKKRRRISMPKTENSSTLTLQGSLPCVSISLRSCGSTAAKIFYLKERRARCSIWTAERIRT